LKLLRKMKPKLKTTLILTGALLLPSFLQAFPPAPHHTFQGMLRDEYGRPITWEEAQIFFETANGEIINGQAGEVLLPGVNYRMKVPMDAGTTRELYQPFAMKADMPFNIHVKVGLKTYLPIEMMGSIRKIGQPGVITPLDLTLGEDTDGDGLPDAWERALLGNGRTLGDINPNDDTDGDGLTNLQEYISGNYAFDKEDGFRVDIVSSSGEGVTLEFLAITGRTYTVQASNDLKQWREVDFIAGDPAAEDAVPQGNISAKDVTKLSVTVPPSEDIAKAKFFKLMVR